MIEVSGHVSDECSIYDLRTSVVLCQPKHVATKVELLLTHVCHRLADHFPDVLSHNGTFSGCFTKKKAQSVNFRRSNVNIIGGLSNHKALFFSKDSRIVVKIFFDIL